MNLNSFWNIVNINFCLLYRFQRSSHRFNQEYAIINNVLFECLFWSRFSLICPWFELNVWIIWKLKCPFYFYSYNIFHGQRYFSWFVIIFNWHFAKISIEDFDVIFVNLTYFGLSFQSSNTQFLLFSVLLLTLCWVRWTGISSTWLKHSFDHFYISSNPVMDIHL